MLPGPGIEDKDSTPGMVRLRVRQSTSRLPRQECEPTLIVKAGTPPLQNGSRFLEALFTHELQRTLLDRVLVGSLIPDDTVKKKPRAMLRAGRASVGHPEENLSLFPIRLLPAASESSAGFGDTSARCPRSCVAAGC